MSPKPLLISLIVVCFVIMLCGCQAQTIDGAEMNNANRLYEEGLLSEAATSYERLIAQGAYDGIIYYNLGNACYRQGDLGHAILNYRRAERLLPRDHDIAENLTLSRSQTVDRLEEGEDSLLAWADQAWRSYLTENEMAWAALVAWLLAGLFGVLLFLQPSGRTAWTYGLSIALIVAVLLGVPLGVSARQERRQPSAVLVASQVDVRSGPGTDYVIEFSLHAGAELRILDQQNGWTRITLPGDLEGWVPQDAVERIQVSR